MPGSRGVRKTRRKCRKRVVGMGDCRDSTIKNWQSNLTSVERNKYMFEHQLMCDVVFSFSKHVGDRTELQGHKFILISRSPVFEAMFMDPSYVESANRVNIDDVELECFNEILRFMYCDEADVSGENVLRIHYGAKKYLLDELVGRCVQFLKKMISPSSVFAVLNHALDVSDKVLIELCLVYIESNSTEVIQNESFLTLSQDALYLVLSCDGIGLEREMDLFLRCMDWAQNKKDKDDELNITTLLGKCLGQIRFASMTIEDFDKIFDLYSECFTIQEQVELFRFKANPSRHLQLQGAEINKNPRDFEQHEINRFPFVRCGTDHPWEVSDSEETVFFKVNTQVHFRAISVLGIAKKNKKCNLHINLMSQKQCLLEEHQEIFTDGTEKPHCVPFNQLQVLNPETVYTLKVSIEHTGRNYFYGISGWDTVQTAGVVFTFVESPGEHIDIANGRICTLVFTKIA